VYCPGRAFARPGTHAGAHARHDQPAVRVSQGRRWISAPRPALRRGGDLPSATRRLTCTLATEERAGLENKIARLQRDNALLKNALLEHGLALPSPPATDPAVPPVAAAPTPEAAPPRPPAPIPPAQADAGEHRQAEVERIISTMERWWRRVVELVATIQHDLQGKD
jgi:hypothetical protein